MHIIPRMGAGSKGGRRIVAACMVEAVAAAGVWLPLGLRPGTSLARASAFAFATADQPRAQKQNTLLPPRRDRRGFPTATTRCCRRSRARISATFGKQANPETGIVRDRCHARTPDKSDLGSIAATGFGLTALCIGEKRGFVSHIEARGTRAEYPALSLEEAAESSRILLSLGQHHHGRKDLGFGSLLRGYGHSAVRNSHLPGALPAFRKSSELALEIFNRVDWNWLSEDTPILPHGWTPETGFLQYRWDDYSEMMMMYLLGIGFGTPSSAGRSPGTRGSEPRSNTTASDTSAPSRPCSCTSIRKPGLISATSVINMRITFRIPFSPPTFIAASAWISRSNSPITATICGASRLRIR